MKLGQKICPNDILDEFESSSWLKNMATSGVFFLKWLYMAIIKPCLNSSSHIHRPVFMKLGHNICPNDILNEFENGSSCKPYGGAFFLIWLYLNHVYTKEAKCMVRSSSNLAEHTSQWHLYWVPKWFWSVEKYCNQSRGLLPYMATYGYSKTLFTL